jgi:hypothetical protein
LRIRQFKTLSDLIGKEKLIWRFDPLILLKGQNPEVLLDKINNIAEKIHYSTEKLVISFIDLSYRKVQQNFKKKEIVVGPYTPIQKREFAENLYHVLKPFNLKLAVCACEEDLSNYQVFPNKCIDDELIARISKNNPALLDLIYQLKKMDKLKDKSQREHCICIISKDIGAYRTCGYSCSYCYAGNASKTATQKNMIFK